MLILAPLVLFVATVAALQSPHRKAPSIKHPAKSFHKRASATIKSGHHYLNNNTQSGFELRALLIEIRWKILIPSQNTGSMGPISHKSHLILAKVTQASYPMPLTGSPACSSGFSHLQIRKQMKRLVLTDLLQTAI
jgi:hypothetical protein